MNRIDRLTGMILLQQGQRVITTEQIAGQFEISVRTVYRDLSALDEAGVPIAAEAGVGYSLMRGISASTGWPHGRRWRKRSMRTPDFR